MRILIVDDSVLMRSQLKLVLGEVSGVNVVGTAASTRIAFERLEQWAIDLVIVARDKSDVNGLEMCAEMRLRGLVQPVLILCEGAAERDQLREAKASGAELISLPNWTKADDLPDIIRAHILPRVCHYQAPSATSAARSPSPHGRVIPITAPAGLRQAPRPATSLRGFHAQAIGIGSSTGGPPVLEQMISKLAKLTAAAARLPIFIAQHMPPTFTEQLAQRLGELSAYQAKEATDGEDVRPGTIYVAPGDFHMRIGQRQGQNQMTIHLDQGPKRNSVRPAIDSLFESLAETYGPSCAAFVLTGMGEDGLIGAKAIRAAAGVVMIQDQASSIVWGMPGAVHAAGAFDAMGDVDQCGDALVQILEDGMKQLSAFHLGRTS